MCTGGKKLDEKAKEQLVEANGHNLVVRSYSKPTYCHHCKKLLWGVTDQAVFPFPSTIPQFLRACVVPSASWTSMKIASVC